MRWAVATAQAADTKLEPDAARELVDALGADMMLIASELEKLLLYTPGRGRITLGDVETMVLAAKQRSLYELTDAISSRNTARALALLHGLLNSSDAGEDAAIGHLYMLARTFRQMLVILEKNVRDSRAIWQALWQGFRMPPFAADDLIRQARRYKSRRELTRALAADCARRSRTALFAARQAAGAGAAGVRPGFGAESRALPAVGVGAAVLRSRRGRAVGRQPLADSPLASSPRLDEADGFKPITTRRSMSRGGGDPDSLRMCFVSHFRAVKWIKCDADAQDSRPALER